MQDDLQVACAAVRAAARAARAARERPLEARVKGVPADVVTAADEAAEAAAVAVLREYCPGDALLGEEGTRAGENIKRTGEEVTRAGEEVAGARGDRRRWLIDGVDGTLAFAARIPSWCAAVALEDDRGAASAAVIDPATGELFAAARGRGATAGGRRLERAQARPLREAVVATFWRPDRLALPGVRATAHALLDHAGLIRHAGPGSLELAWVADGRLDAWIQPAPDPWDWLPGALLVREAGGVARVVPGATPWHVAGPPELVDELAALVR